MEYRKIQKKTQKVEELEEEANSQIHQGWTLIDKCQINAGGELFLVLTSDENYIIKEIKILRGTWTELQTKIKMLDESWKCKGIAPYNHGYIMTFWR